MTLEISTCVDPYFDSSTLYNTFISDWTKFHINDGMYLYLMSVKNFALYFQKFKMHWQKK